MSAFQHCGLCKTPNPRASYLTHCVRCGAPLSAFGSATAAAETRAAAGTKRALLVRAVSLACAAYAALALAVLGTMYGLGDRWWAGTLLIFGPRWFWAVPAVVLLPAALVVRRRALWGPFLALLLTFGPIMGYHLPWPRGSARSSSPTPPPNALRVLSCNIHFSRLDAPAFTALIAASQPHVVALQEWSASYAIPEGQGRRGWFVKMAGELCVCSRYPIVEVETLDDRAAGINASVGRFVIRAPDGDVDVFNLHLSSARNGLSSLKGNPLNVPRAVDANLADRSRDSEVASQWVRSKARGRAVLAGDFNLPPESAIYRTFWSEYKDAFVEAGSGYGYTWFSGWHGLRIDRILSRGWRCSQFWVGPDVGSDHRPIVADLTPGPES